MRLESERLRDILEGNNFSLDDVKQYIGSSGWMDLPLANRNVIVWLYNYAINQEFRDRQPKGWFASIRHWWSR